MVLDLLSKVNHCLTSAGKKCLTLNLYWYPPICSVTVIAFPPDILDLIMNLTPSEYG